MSAVQSLTEAVRDLLSVDATLRASIREFTTREFPYCDEFPAVHVNALSATDDTSVGGMGRRIRTVRLRVYITVTAADSMERESNLWTLIDRARAVIDADRTFGGRLTIPTIRLPVISIPSPTGSYYVGTRAVEFDAELAELL